MATKIELIKQWLTNEGYKSEIDSDGDLVFRFQGANLICPASTDDPLYLQIIMPGIYTFNNGERVKVLEAISSLCRERKCVKAFVAGEDLHLSLEMLIDTSPEIDDFFERGCTMLIQARMFMMEKILH